MTGSLRTHISCASTMPWLWPEACLLGNLKERKAMSVMVVVVLIAVLSIAGIAASILNSRLLVRDRNEERNGPRLLKQVAVRLDELPSVVEAMSYGSGKVRYAGITFNTADRPSEDDAVNLNLSVENGTVGFDWVLLAPRNLEDEGRFRAFVQTQGAEPITRSTNGVSYLRVEGVDTANLIAGIVTEMYQHPSTEPLQLVHEGFTWPSS